MATTEHDTIEHALPRAAALPAGPRVRHAGECAARHLRAALEELWERRAATGSPGSSPFTELYEWEPPYAKWYLGGKLNVCFNCVDRHVEAGHGDKVAYHWEGEPERRAPHAHLRRPPARGRPVRQRAQEARRPKGTPVAIYMGMVPELPIAMLACARLGAPHTVVFGGFSADSLSGRMNDMECELLITQDEAWRARQNGAAEAERGRGARRAAPTVKQAVVLRRTGDEVAMRDGRDVWWHDARRGRERRPGSCPCEPMDSEDLLYLLYTSRDDRQAEGHRPHDRRLPRRRRDDAPLHLRRQARLGVLVRGRHRLGHRPQLHRLRPALQRHDRGASTRACPNYPERGPLVGDRRALQGRHPLHGADRDPRAHEVGRRSTPRSTTSRRCACSGRSASRSTPRPGSGTASTSAATACPVVDTWWQTETGMIMITPLPGVTTLKPGSATKPFPGVDAAVYDEQGNEVGPGGGGYLVLRRPWPAMLRGIYRDHDRYVRDVLVEVRRTSTSPATAPAIDEDGDFWLLGPRRRRDERLRAPDLDDRGRVGARRPPGGGRGGGLRPQGRDPTGQAIVAYVTLKGGRGGLGRDARGAPRPRRARRSGRSRSRRTSSSRRSCRRRAAARSCAACSATSPRTGRSATRRRSPTRPSSRRSRSAARLQPPTRASRGRLAAGACDRAGASGAAA